MKILLVEDEPGILTQLEELLREQRYLVDTAVNGAEALDKVFANLYDLLVLDIMLPKLDGLSLLREIRRAAISTPVLFLTARGGIEDKVKGLDCGADDYLAKPFSTAELLARIRALLRRPGREGNSLLQVGDISLDTVSREVVNAGRPLELTPKEFSLLEFLLYNKNQPVSRITLAEHVWGEDFDPFTMSNTIDVHIKNLRRKLDPEKSGRALIQTVRGVGFVARDTPGDQEEPA
ncbi:MAG TPA: response regulator transcription factor [Proteobacteria bacterium]|nr:response regulator transcription factor [Pseudomonadota bacterium]